MHRHSGGPAGISSDTGLGEGCAWGLVICIKTYSFCYLQINIPCKMIEYIYKVSWVSLSSFTLNYVTLYQRSEELGVQKFHLTEQRFNKDWFKSSLI